MSARSAGLLLLFAGAAHADPLATPAGTVLLRFDGAAHTPKDVLSRTKAAAERRYEVRYAPKNEIAKFDPVKPIRWGLRFATVEDPKTRARWLRGLEVVLLENSEMVCTGTTSSLVAGTDKLSFDDDPVRAAMMIDVNVSCMRPRDGYQVGCGGSVVADGRTPTGCNPTQVASPRK